MVTDISPYLHTSLLDCKSAPPTITCVPFPLRWAAEFGDATPTAADPPPADEAALLVEERSVHSTGGSLPGGEGGGAKAALARRM